MTFIFLNDGRAQTSSFDLDGKSHIVLANKTNDSISIKIGSFTTWPYKDNRLKKTLFPKAELKLELKNQGSNYAFLIIESEAYNIFIQPGSIDTLTLLSSDNGRKVEFSGHSKRINEFQDKKARHFNSTKIDFMGRSASYLGKNNSYERIAAINDSITKVNMDYMIANSLAIPKWNFDFETKRIHLNSARHKITAALYKKLAQNIKEPVPLDYLENVIVTLPINDQEMVGNNRYMWLLRDLISFKTEYPFNERLEGKQNRINRKIGIIQNELSGTIKDAYLASEFCGLIDDKLLIDSTWLDLVQEKEFHKFLKHYSTEYDFLPAGTDLPYFYLPDTSSIFYEPSQFKNRIVLINFWNAGCKPCIQDFPHENDLVDRYKNEPVTILNISTSSRLWEKTIAKHHLKSVNLLAQEIGVKNCMMLSILMTYLTMFLSIGKAK